ncbi:MAG TPA: alpha/beta fold hydrolase [Candidatus Limnocylindrales bacterium]|nr:alpha/beta fold hydrolase [Candidatus Limnocylindrales bacterium]
MERDIFFPCGDLRLQGRLSLPEQPAGGVVICHPHPLYGGSMDNNVVIALAEHLRAAGQATLRFNFRGVGRSGGIHAGGRGETADAAAALAFLASEIGVSDVALAGYSFGAAVALASASHDLVSCVVAVAPPLAMMGELPAPSLAKPVLLLAGDRDPYCRLGDFEQLSRALPALSQTVVVSGADHFLIGHEEEVGRAAATFVCPPQAGS